MGSGPPDDLTLLVNDAAGGDSRASEELLPLVYEHLRVLAAQRLSKERPGQTLQPTALVHEAYLRLVAGGKDLRWNSRRHFFSAAAIAMRRILVERARRVAGPKRGGGYKRVPLRDDIAGSEVEEVDLVGLDAAMRGLERHDGGLHELVMLRYFAGLSTAETASALGVSERTAQRDLEYARAWLFRAMTGDQPEDKGGP